jgi:hypothetical protein
VTKITYEIVRHDGGWAYRVDETYSEPFPSHELASDIDYEDKQGRWHHEKSAGDDRPETDVEG